MLILLLKELRHRWIIYMLTVVLVSAIIALLVIQSSINSSAEEKLNDLSHKLGSSMLVVPDGTDLEKFYRMSYGPEVMPDDYPARIRSSSLAQHVRMLEPRLYGNVSVRGADLILVGHSGAGQSPGPPDESPAAMSSVAAGRLGLAVNDTMEIGGERLRLMRIIDPPPKGLDLAVFVPLPVAQRVLGRPGKINALHMGGCWCKLDVPTFAGEVETILPGTMAITVDGMAKAQQEIIQVMERYSALLWVSGSVLATGSIMFLILFSIFRGGREIGLLLSIGLSPGRIVLKNIVVSAGTAVAGTIAGFLASAPLMSYLGVSFLRIRLEPSWDFLPWFVAAALVAALVAASFPSLYVTRLDPTKLLRED